VTVKRKLQKGISHAKEHHLAAKSVAAALFFVVYPLIIVGAFHIQENRSVKRSIDSAAKIERDARHHADLISCKTFNASAYSSNTFHKTIKRFVIAARDVRRSEIAALKGSNSPRVKKVLKADRLAVKYYNDIIKNILFTRYRPGCRIPNSTTRNVPRKH
jgi:hypothetical protein